MSITLKRASFPESNHFTDMQTKLQDVLGIFNDFKIQVSASDKKGLRVMGAKRAGYADQVMVALRLYVDRLPRDYDPEKISEFRVLHNELAQLLGLIQKIEERASDMDFMVRYLIMNLVDEGYNHIKTFTDFRKDMDNKVISKLKDFNKRKKQDSEASPIDNTQDATNNENSNDKNDVEDDESNDKVS